MERHNVATEEQIQCAIDSLDLIPPCPTCGMRYCQGDYECPHCGADLDENLRTWADAMIDRVAQIGQKDGSGS